MTTKAVQDVLAERQRQIDVEGFTIASDHANNGEGDLAAAGSSYALSAACALDPRANALDEPPYAWPWEEKWWKPTTPRRDLVKAAALMIAAIESIDREVDQL